MPYKWCDKNKGVLKLGSGSKKKFFQPGQDIPDQYINDALLERFEAQIVEYVRERAVKRPKSEPKKDKK
jgi:hypothetical protein